MSQKTASDDKLYCRKHFERGPLDAKLRAADDNLKSEKNNLKRWKIYGKLFFSNFKHYRKKNEGY